MNQIDAPDFSLRHTLESGQAFRWRCTEGGYVGIVDGGVVEVRQEGPRLLYRSSAPETLNDAWLRRYFALDLDLPVLLRDINRDPQIHEAIRRFRGLRVIRQEPWECLASYILSSFNNIKRIEGMIERLARQFGAPVRLDAYAGHTFPTVEALADAPIETLTDLGLGFRAAYLRDTARAVRDRRVDLAGLRRVSYDEAKAALVALPGVGDKVADCVLLFGCEQMEAFPIDVWIERALGFHFRRHLPLRSRLHVFARRHFGRWAGYAQQYLFHHLRSKARTPELRAVAPSAPSAPSTERRPAAPRPAVASALAQTA